MSCCTLIAFFPKMVRPVLSNLEKTETERVSENVRVKVSSIRPVFIQTVVHNQQRDKACLRLFGCLGYAALSLYMAVK